MSSHGEQHGANEHLSPLEQHGEGLWLDEWGTLLVILFGLLFVLVLVSWNPTI